MKENKYGVKEVIDLMVYNEQGELITKLDTLQNSHIIVDEDGGASLIARDALLDINLLRFAHGNSLVGMSDFDSLLNHVKNNRITFGINNLKKKCKLVATSTMRNPHTMKDETVYYEIPDADILNSFNHEANYDTPSVFDLRFVINPNSDGELFYLYI